MNKSCSHSIETRNGTLKTIQYAAPAKKGGIMRLTCCFDQMAASPGS